MEGTCQVSNASQIQRLDAVFAFLRNSAISPVAEAGGAVTRPGEGRLLLLIVAAGVFAVLPIIVWGIPTGADLFNHYRFALPFYESIRSGHFYAGWLAESNAGYGDPRFRFYPPGLYYMLAAARVVTGWYTASILTFGALSIVGGLGLFFWARNFCSPRVAMWAGIAYTVAPYHLNQLYQASFLSEYAACSLLPFAFAFADRICKRHKARDIAGFAAAYGLLILTHVPMAVIGSLALFVYAALLLRRESLWRSLISLTVAGSLGLLASACFWTTVLAELSWIKSGSVSPNLYYDYRVNFLFSPWAIINRNTWYAGLLGVVVIGSLAPALILINRRFFSRSSDRSLKAVFFLTLTSILMTTDLSRPVWAMLPKLQQVQFPWRWLGITSMSGCIFLAVAVPGWLQRMKIGFRRRDVVAIAGLLLAFWFVTDRVLWNCEYYRRAELNALLPEIRGAVSFKDWLPIWAQDVTQLKKMTSNVEAESRTVTIDSWEPQLRKFHIESGPATEARIHTYYYPLWTATSKGKQLATHPSKDGAILIAIPASQTDVTLEFREPRRVEVARFATLFGWILIAALFATPWFRKTLTRRPVVTPIPSV
jgi:6-pyruvoyl-tetrahydropterin synthase related domain